MSENLKIYDEISESIQRFNSRNLLHSGISDKEFDALLSSADADIKIEEAVNKYLTEFVKKAKLEKYVMHLGMTFVRMKRFPDGEKKISKPYFFHYIKEDYKETFENWLAPYKNLTVKSNEFLCDPAYEKYWTRYQFPRFIIYSNHKPYVGTKLSEQSDELTLVEMTIKEHGRIFNSNIEELNKHSQLMTLHKMFIDEESWSPFKIFLTSNFRDTRSQTFIKFSQNICNIHDPAEFERFLGLCYFIDLTIGSVIYDFDLIIHRDEYKKEILTHGTKAAITAIMSRNLSHNIGSHVLSYWNQALAERTPSAYEDIAIDYKKLAEKTFGDFENRLLESEKAIYKSRELFQYIQHRMDFLAEVSTSIPSSEVSLDIEEDILKPVFKPSHPSTLMEFIAKSEGLNLVNKVIIEVNSELKQAGEQRVSIPNGIIGCHAIYSILENFIRNAAKHYKPSIPEEVADAQKMLGSIVERIEAIENSETNKHLISRSAILPFVSQCKDSLKSLTDISQIKEVIEILLVEVPFIKIVVQKPDREDWKRDYLVLLIWDMREQSCNREIVDNYRDDIKKDFTDGGRLAPGAWGIKEMVTSANFLRKNKPEALLNRIIAEENDESKLKEPRLLDVLCGDRLLPNGDLGKNNCCLTYERDKKTELCRKNDVQYRNRLGIRLFLLKPKDLLIVDNGMSASGKIFTLEEEKADDKYIADGTILKEIPHRMLLVSKQKEKESFEQNPQAPCRIMTNSNDSTVDDVGYLKLYEEFIKKEILYKEEFPVLLNNIGEKYWFRTPFGISYDDRKRDEIRDQKLVFENHPETGRRCDEVRKIMAQSLFFQPISGGFSPKSKLTNGAKLQNDLYKQFQLELIESAIAKVIIVDERISELASSYYLQDLKKSDIYLKMNIYVIDVERRRINCTDLTEKLFAADSKGFGVFNEDLKKNAHFIVIHQGILDKLSNEEAINIMNSIKCRWKIIDSGRGVPVKLDRYGNVRFVEISALQKMIEHYDKHALVQTLMSLRMPGI